MPAIGGNIHITHVNSQTNQSSTCKHIQISNHIKEHLSKIIKGLTFDIVDNE